MAANQPQEKEWVPRSHIAGPAFGTLSRASANRAKLFAQLIEEEEEEKKLIEDRPDVGGAYTEVALIRCKNDADGKKWVKLMKKLIKNRAAGEAFHQIYELDKGSGVHFSEFMLVSVGNPGTYSKFYKDRSPEDTAEMVKLVKRYNSTIYITRATQEMKDIVKELNSREQNDKNIIGLEGSNTYTNKPVDIDIAESPNYRFETGQKLIKDFLKDAGKKLMVRVERIETTTKEGMDAVEKAVGELYAAPHRNALAHNWRPSVRRSIGFAELLNTPLAFLLKMDETHVEVVIFDLLTDFEQDAAYAEKNEIISGALSHIKQMTVYVHSAKKEKELTFLKGKCGPPGHPEKTFTQENHIFGKSAEFTVVPGKEML